MQKNESILHFLFDCGRNNIGGKSWVKWWELLTGFNIREENPIHESILFEIPRYSDDTIVINYCTIVTVPLS